MKTPQDRPAIPAGPRTRDGKGKPDNASAFEPDDAAVEGETQSRDAEQALDRAIGRLPPG